LNLRIFDIVMLNETNLDPFAHPLSTLKNPYYSAEGPDCLRWWWHYRLYTQRIHHS
jgi:hypothetical protein